MLDVLGVFGFGFSAVAFIGALSLPAGLYIAGQSESFWVFALGLAFFGGLFGGGFAFAPLVADTSHWFEKRRGLAVGIVISGTYLSGAIWPPILQLWIDDSGWRQATLDLSLFTLLTMMPLTLVYLRKPNQDAPGNNQNNTFDWDRPLGFGPGQLQWLICCAGIGCCVAMAMPQIHIVPHVIDLGYAARDGAYMLALMLGFGIVSRIASGWISDRIGGVRTLALGSLFQGLVIFSFLFVDTLTGLFIVSIAFGLSQGGIVPSYSIIIRKYFRAREAASRIGYAFVATTLGMALGGWMAGVLYDLTGSYTLSFVNAIGFNILNLAIAGWLLRRVSLGTACG